MVCTVRAKFREDERSSIYSQLKRAGIAEIDICVCLNVRHNFPSGVIIGREYFLDAYGMWNSSGV